jgi:hypothetical protein
LNYGSDKPNPLNANLNTEYRSESHKINHFKSVANEQYVVRASINGNKERTQSVLNMFSLNLYLYCLYLKTNVDLLYKYWDTRAAARNKS